MIRTPIIAIATLLLFALLSGCNQRHSPIEVSRAFWKAVQAGNAGAVKTLVTSASRASVKADGMALEIDQIELGRTVIDGDQASVDTHLVVQSENPLQLPLKTRLQREEGQWHYDATMASLEPGGSLSQALNAIGEIGRVFSDQVAESMGEIEQKLPEIKRQLEQAQSEIQRQMPEVRRQLEEMLNKLRESLKRLPVEPPPGEQAI